MRMPPDPIMCAYCGHRIGGRHPKTYYLSVARPDKLPEPFNACSPAHARMYVVRRKREGDED